MNLFLNKSTAAMFGVSQRIVVSSVQNASDLWCAMRDESCMGVSEIGNGANVLDDNGKRIARISYNGRIWV